MYTVQQCNAVHLLTFHINFTCNNIMVSTTYLKCYLYKYRSKYRLVCISFELLIKLDKNVFTTPGLLKLLTNYNLPTGCPKQTLHTHR